MRMQNIPLDQIVHNPWRDMTVYPIDPEHVKELRASIKRHGFFGGIKGRRHNGVIELGCGHHRVEAARKEGLDTVPVFIEDMDEDKMIALMTEENATQQGQSGAAILSDVAAVMRRLVTILLDPSGDNAPIGALYFDGKKGFGTARGKLLAGMRDPNKDGGLGWVVIQRYLGNLRTKRQIIEAITTLKQSARYDHIIEDEISKHPQPVLSAPPAKKKEVAYQPTPKRVKVYDDRCAAVFPNDYQAQAFREAVTTEGAKKFIPVTQQYALANKIVESKDSNFKDKHAGAPYIKRMVKGVIEDASALQRKINKEEDARWKAEQIDNEIESELYSANASYRSLLSAVIRINSLARKYPRHPKIGGFSAKLDRLVEAIEELSKTLK